MESFPHCSQPVWNKLIFFFMTGEQDFCLKNLKENDAMNQKSKTHFYFFKWLSLSSTKVFVTLIED